MDDLISRQAAIEAINSHFGFNVEEEYGSAVQEVINGLPPAQPEPRWIPVEEHLPDLGVIVWVTLVIFGRNIVTKGQWDGVKWIYPKSRAKITLKVTAWMPIQIPKPYERSEDGEM